MSELPSAPTMLPTLDKRWVRSGHRCIARLALTSKKQWTQQTAQETLKNIDQTRSEDNQMRTTGGSRQLCAAMKPCRSFIALRKRCHTFVRSSASSGVGGTVSRSGSAQGS